MTDFRLYLRGSAAISNGKQDETIVVIYTWVYRFEFELMLCAVMGWDGLDVYFYAIPAS